MKASIELVRQQLLEIEELVAKHKPRILHPAFFAALDRKFQGDFSKVFDLLSDCAVKKYVFKPSDRVVWIVKGKGRDYLIYPEAPYCHCTNFYVHVINGQAKVCVHIVAQRIASILNIPQIIDERDDLYDTLMKEWKSVENAEN